MEKNWAELSPEERRQERFQRWLSPEGVKFSSGAAEKSYKERVTRFTDVIQLKKPDRVPVILPAGFFPAYYAGVDLKTVIYDYRELGRAWKKFLHDFDMDVFSPPTLLVPGKAFDMLDYNLYKWPGGGLSADVFSYQFVEKEYMKPDEYDALINDPSDFWLRVYLPRIFGAFKPFRELPPFTSIVEIPNAYLTVYSQPDVRKALQLLLDAGEEMGRWREVIGDCIKEAQGSGVPVFTAVMTKAPFDTIGDTLRGTSGIMLDMFQRPDKLLEAMERITPLSIDMTVAAANAAGAVWVSIPLHKGADGFMSEKHFNTFYWPSLKKVILGLVEEGLVPLLFAEGSYMTRLEIVKDLPRGSVMWRFDRTDMGRAKEILGDVACISGNVPTSLMLTGTPLDVKKYCRKVIEVAGQGGGLVLNGGANMDRGNPDNLRAMMGAAREYGVYK